MTAMSGLFYLSKQRSISNNPVIARQKPGPVAQCRGNLQPTRAFFEYLFQLPIVPPSQTDCHDSYAQSHTKSCNDVEKQGFFSKQRSNSNTPVIARLKPEPIAQRRGNLQATGAFFEYLFQLPIVPPSQTDCHDPNAQIHTQSSNDVEGQGFFSKQRSNSHTPVIARQKLEPVTQRRGNLQPTETSYSLSCLSKYSYEYRKGALVGRHPEPVEGWCVGIGTNNRSMFPRLPDGQGQAQHDATSVLKIKETL